MRIAEILSWQQQPAQQPRRPHDIIDFLMARGGIRDYGGELRYMDLHRVQKGKFGRLARRNGMSLDTAREVAAEGGYIDPNGDINDLLQALFDTTHGQPVYSRNDSNDVLAWQQDKDAERRRQEEDDFWNPNNLFAESRLDELRTVGHFNRADQPLLRTSDRNYDQARAAKTQIIVLMPPLHFLKLASPPDQINSFLKNSQRLKAYNSYIKTGETMVLPFLRIDIGLAYEGVVGRVTGHEGRHRAAAVHNAGGKWMRVGLQLRSAEDYQPELARQDQEKHGHYRNNMEYYLTQADLPVKIQSQYNQFIALSPEKWKVENGDYLSRYRR